MWLFYSLLDAISDATKDVFSKKGLGKMDEYLVAWGWRFFTFLFLVPLLFFMPIPKLDFQFWQALIISGVFGTITSVLFMRAIKLSPLSLTIPILTFTPVFLLIPSSLILKEFPNVYGFIGILLIIFGAYLLNIQETKGTLIGPFKALIKERGPILMLLVTFIWGITGSFDKVGVLHSSSLFWAISINFFLFLILSVIILLKRRNFKSEIIPNVKTLLPMGFFAALSMSFQMTAIKMTLVPYTTAVKQTRIIFSSLYGFLIFKEQFIKSRLLAVSIMVLGALFITLS